MPLAPAHQDKELRIERVTGREGYKRLLDVRQRNGSRLKGIARHKAAGLTMQIVVAEHRCAVRAVIGPIGLGRIGARDLMECRGMFEQKPAYFIRQPSDVKNARVCIDFLPLAVIEHFMIWR